jgi:hypothetical protein
MVDKKIEDVRADFEEYRAKMDARVDALVTAAQTAQQNGAEVPPGVQSQINALAEEIEQATASDGNVPVEPTETAPSGEDNEPAGSGPSAGDTGLPEPVSQPDSGEEQVGGDPVDGGVAPGASA